MLMHCDATLGCCFRLVLSANDCAHVTVVQFELITVLDANVNNALCCVLLSLVHCTLAEQSK